MKANELQADDYLSYNGQVIKVESITKKKVGYHLKPNECHLNYARLCECKPIPLTTEILEKNDFLANKHVDPYPYYEYINEKDKVKIGFAFPQGNRTSYKELWVYIYSECALIVHLPCKYAHHLQHVLKLCGIEKEIIL